VSDLLGVVLRSVRTPFLFDDGAGPEDHLLIVTCIHFGYSLVVPVESLDCVFSIVEVFCLL